MLLHGLGASGHTAPALLSRDLLVCSGTRGTPAPGVHQLLLSCAPLCPSTRTGVALIQACGMQPTKGLKALKCSFSEGWAFLKCQKSWKKQLAPLPAAWAKQPGLTMAERCLCSPHRAGGQGAPRAVPMKAPLCPTKLLQGWWARRSHCKAKAKCHLPPMYSSHSAEKEKSQSHLQLLSTYANKTPPSAGHLCHSTKPITYLYYGGIGIEQQISTVVKGHPMVPGGPCAEGVSVLQHEHYLASTS